MYPQSEEAKQIRATTANLSTWLASHLQGTHKELVEPHAEYKHHCSHQVHIYKAAIVHELLQQNACATCISTFDAQVVVYEVTVSTTKITWVNPTVY